MAVVVTVTVATVTAHHSRVAVTLLLAVRVRRHAVALAVRVRLLGTHGRERAAEASSAALEVGETAAGAGPVTGTWAVLGRRERSEKRWASRRLRACSAVKNARGRRRDLNGAVVKSASIHAERFGGLHVTSVSDVEQHRIHDF
jgi:hypothetical protein